jgi:hypothetical protein
MKLLNSLKTWLRLRTTAGDWQRTPTPPKAFLIPTRYLCYHDWQANGNDVLWLRELFQDERFQRFLAALRANVAPAKVEFDKNIALATYYRQIGHEDVFRGMIELQQFEPEPLKDVPMDYSGALDEGITRQEIPGNQT